MNVIASFPPGKSDFERIVTFTSPPNPRTNPLEAAGPQHAVLPQSPRQLQSPRRQFLRFEFGSFYILSSWLGSISADIRPRESQLCLKELAESNLTPLAPVARHFVTAKGFPNLQRRR